MRKSVLFMLIALLIVSYNMVSYGSVASKDSTFIEGKGMYLWQLWNSNGGGKNLNAVITKLQSIGATWLVIKMGDGDSNYNTPNHSLYNWVTSNYKNMDSVVAIFHANGIKLLAFQYVYGVPHYWGNPASETDVANSILSVKGIDGLLIDAEVQYDTLTNRVEAAQAYCDSIHAHHPDAYIGLTAWARVDGHNTFPWTTFLERIEVNMPQTYWAARPTTPQNELSIMSSQFTYWTNTWVSLGYTGADKPIMPIGQGEYFGYGNDVKQGDVASFCNLSQTTYNYPGISLWEYNQIAHSYVWDEYASAWPGGLLPVELTSFNVATIGNSVLLKWSTATENNNLGFEIEKSSDGRNFQKISFINGKGNSTKLNSYSYQDDGVNPGTYYYRLKQIDDNGSFIYSSVVKVQVGSVVKEYNLFQNYPNPFNPTTTINYEVPKSGLVIIQVYNVLGKEVASLVNEEKQAGKYSIQFSADKYNLSSGVYFYRMQTENFVETKKLILMK